MMIKRLALFLALPVCILSLNSGIATAQMNGGGGPGGGGFDPAMIQQMIQQAQQRMLDNIKTQLGSTDDEFAVLQPRIQKVMQLQFSLQAGRFASRMPPGMAAALAGNLNLGASPQALQQAMTELQGALDDTTTSSQIIENKLAAMRAAKAKVNEDLTAAQNDLLQLLTQRQEAVLVLQGLLQ